MKLAYNSLDSDKNRAQPDDTSLNSVKNYVKFNVNSLNSDIWASFGDVGCLWRSLGGHLGVTWGSLGGHLSVI